MKATEHRPTHVASSFGLEFSKLFEPDALTSAKFYQNSKRTYYGNVELRLIAAVFEDAVATLMTDVRRCTKRQRRDFEETMRWIVARDNDEWVFSFVNVCESLAIDANYLRAGLIRKVGRTRGAKRPDPLGKTSCQLPRRKVVG